MGAAPEPGAVGAVAVGPPAGDEGDEPAGPFVRAPVAALAGDDGVALPDAEAPEPDAFPDPVCEGALLAAELTPPVATPPAAPAGASAAGEAVFGTAPAPGVATDDPAPAGAAESRSTRVPHAPSAISTPTTPTTRQ